MKTSSHTPPFIVTEAATFIGIDYHKKYSVWHAVDAAGRANGVRVQLANGVRVQLADKTAQHNSRSHFVISLHPFHFLSSFRQRSLHHRAPEPKAA